VRKAGRAQAKIGRPFGAFKKIDEAKLIADIAAGVPVPIVCAAVGIHKDTFNQWLDDRQFYNYA